MCEEIANSSLARLRAFIDTELSSMVENVASNYESNMEGRQLNPFLHFNNGDITKYMALGRSIDSQLGNRVQRIAFYMARMRYGVEFVPNIVSIKTVDDTEHSVELIMYSVDCDVELTARLTNFNPFKQIVKINKQFNDEQVRKSLKISKRKYTDVIKKSAYIFHEISEHTYEYIRSFSGKEFPVDLLLFEGNNNITRSEAYEIKMGGNLDTKNASSNADEVNKLSQVLNFIANSQAYFATCYGTCSAAVSDRIIPVLGDSAILNGEQFWDHIISAGEGGFTYAQFIETFQNAFSASGLEESIHTL